MPSILPTIDDTQRHGGQRRGSSGNAEGGRGMKLIRRFVLAVASLAMWLTLPAHAQDFIAGIPRNETLIIQGGAAQNADWFNLWAAGGGSASILAHIIGARCSALCTV